MVFTCDGNDAKAAWHASSSEAWAASLAGEQGAAAVTDIPMPFDLPVIGAPFQVAQAWTRVPLDDWDVDLPLVFTNADGTEGAVYLKVNLLQ